MRAWDVTASSDGAPVLKMAERARRSPGPGEVEVQVHGVGLGFPDYLLTRGLYHDRPQLPFTIGGEAAGVVTAVGGGVSDVLPGQRVIVAPGGSVYGYCAEFLTVPAERLLPVPDDMPMEVASVLFVAYQTAHLGLFRRGVLQPGDVLLVHAAAGGVGSAAVQLGKAAGAQVIAVAGGADKTAMCRELGADVVVDHCAEDFVTIVKERTSGRGVDVAFDPVGGDVFDRTRRCMAVEGRLVVVGFASGKVPSAPANHALLKNYSIVGFRTRPFRDDSETRRRIHAELLARYAAGHIAPRVSVVSFEDVPAAIEKIGAGSVLGRLSVEIRKVSATAVTAAEVSADA